MSDAADANAQRRWRGCSASCAGCAIRRTAARGIANRISRASRRTPSKRPTKWPRPSRAASRAALEGELGDLLFQVVFHAQMGSERGSGSISRAWPTPSPTSSPSGIRMCSPDAQHRFRRRTESRLGRTQGARTRGAAPTAAGSELADVPLALPALARAAKLGKRAGRVGFDWPDAHRRAREDR